MTNTADRHTARRRRPAARDVVLAVWALVVVAPMLWAFLGSFKTNPEIFGSPWSLPADLRTDNWTRAWTTANIGRYFFNSVLVVGVSAAGTMLFGAMAAYVLALYRFRAQRVLYYLFVAGLAFPVFLAIAPLFFVVRNLGLLNTYTGLILVYIAYALPFTVFFLVSFFKTLPASVFEAAMLDGCSHTRTFFQVMLPLARPGLASMAILNVIGLWGQYILPVVLVSDPDKAVLTQGIAAISVNAGYQSDWPALFAAISMTILPMIVAYAFFHRQIQAGLTTGATK